MSGLSGGETPGVAGGDPAGGRALSAPRRAAAQSVRQRATSGSQDARQTNLLPQPLRLSKLVFRYLPSGLPASKEVLLTIVRQDPDAWSSRSSPQQATPGEAPSSVYEVTTCLDGSGERSAPLGTAASKNGR